MFSSPATTNSPDRLAPAFSSPDSKPVPPSLSQIKSELQNMPHIMDHGGMFQKRVGPSNTEQILIETRAQLDQLLIDTKARFDEIDRSFSHLRI